MRRAAIAACALLALVGDAHAHGGLPISQRILRKAGGDTIYMPVIYWGIWVGQDVPGEEWKWICEEAINTNRTRRLALSTDGTFYTNDTRGVQVSTDSGCTWNHVGGELANLRATDVDADPVDGATGYVVTGDGGSTDGDGAITLASNALFITHDHGQTFSRAPGLSTHTDLLFHSVRVAPTDANTIYVTSTANGTPFNPQVHWSSNGGQNFSDMPLAYQLDGVTPYSLEVMKIDPRDSKVLYVRVFAAVPDPDLGTVAREALLRSVDNGQNFSEIWKMDGVINPSSGISRGIDGLDIDATRGKVFVATVAGVLVGGDAGASQSTVTLAATGNLSQSQCVDVHGAAVYACASNYAPDNAALARSDDAGGSFSRVMQYVDTVGPVDCPASTPVGQICPQVWQMYATQLGIIDGLPDGGVDLGGTHTTSNGCGCDVGGAPIAFGGALAAALLALVTVVLVRARRRG